MKQLVPAMTRAASMILMLLVLVAAGCQQPDSSQNLKSLVDKDLEVWNTGNVKDLNAIVDPSFVRHENLQPDVKGVDGLSKLISGMRTAYPDLKVVVDEEIYGDNKAVIRWTFTGTITGRGKKHPPGKSVKILGIDIIHFANGKITERWAAFDNLSVLQQLGLTRTPPAAAKP